MMKWIPEIPAEGWEAGHKAGLAEVLPPVVQTPPEQSSWLPWTVGGVAAGAVLVGAHCAIRVRDARRIAAGEVERLLVDIERDPLAEATEHTPRLSETPKSPSESGPLSRVDILKIAQARAAEQAGDTWFMRRIRTAMLEKIDQLLAEALREQEREREAKKDHLIGKVISGRYTVLSKIRAGGMGALYKARDRMGRDVAIKVMKPEFLADAEAVERFRREAQALLTLKHPNIVQIIDFGQVEGNGFYLAMEYLDGKSIWELTAGKKQTPLGVKRTVVIARQILQALIAAHAKGMFHRDLQSGNVMVMQYPGQADFVKLIDFGIVKIVGADTLTGRAPLGTPHYLAPEQVRGKPFDARGDLYTVGVLMYRMLTGKTPFQDHPGSGPETASLLHAILHEPPPPLVLPEGEVIGPALENLVLRALAKTPEERPQTAEAFLAELEHAWSAEGLPKTGPMPGSN